MEVEAATLLPLPSCRIPWILLISSSNDLSAGCTRVKAWDRFRFCWAHQAVAAWLWPVVLRECLTDDEATIDEHEEIQEQATPKAGWRSCSWVRRAESCTRSSKGAQDSDICCTWRWNAEAQREEAERKKTEILETGSWRMFDSFSVKQSQTARLPMSGLRRSWKTSSRSCIAKEIIGCCAGRRSEQFAEANADCRGKSRQNGITQVNSERNWPLLKCPWVRKRGWALREKFGWRRCRCSTLEDGSWPCPWAICSHRTDRLQNLFTSVGVGPTSWECREGREENGGRSFWTAAVWNSACLLWIVAASSL